MAYGYCIACSKAVCCGVIRQTSEAEDSHWVSESLRATTEHNLMKAERIYADLTALERHMGELIPYQLERIDGMTQVWGTSAKRRFKDVWDTK